MKPRLFVIRGLPGSSKTTLARQLNSAIRESSHYEADMWMVDEHGNYRFDPKRLPFCHEQCQLAVERAMEKRVDVIVSNTFVRKWEMEPYLALADKYDYLVVMIECRGSFGSVHSVPDEVMARMRATWEKV